MGLTPSFARFEEFFAEWASRAQPAELRRIVELIGEELARRGHALTWTVAPRRNHDRRA